MFEAKITYADGAVEEAKLSVNENGNVKEARLSEEGLDANKIASIDVLVNETEIKAGDKGFFLLPGNNKLSEPAIGSFKAHADANIECAFPRMTVMGINHNDKAYITFATGMREIMWYYVEIKDNTYKFYLRFAVRTEEIYEDIVIRTHYLSGDLSYSAMAREYRSYILANGFKSIKERLHPALRYAAETMYVRVRQGWKPVPCQVVEQTDENEPPVHVAATFADVEKLMHAYKKAGIEKAEFCLVGFNNGGHDGRWPQIMPAEKTLGGTEGLKKLIKTAHELGYTICCHTNSTDGYSLAKNLCAADVAQKKDRSLSIQATYWGGGRTYNVCPKRAYEISCQTLPELAELGFSGTHYIDVITATPPRNCWSNQHKVNYKEGVEYFDKLFILSRELFGCIGSECSFDFNYKYYDYTLYDSFRRHFKNERQDGEADWIDEFVPFTQLVYHGIVLSNPSSGTVNAALNEDPQAMLKMIEYGGRPAIYYYSKFVSNGNDWMGGKDFRMSTEEELKESVEASKKTYDIYNELSYLQYEFMEKHERVADKVYEITYSDGSKITVDYNNNTYKLEK